jgi:peroxiredoxin
MARIGTPLDNLEMFPAFELQLITGDRVQLPEATEDRFGVVLFYRGSW